MHQILDKGLSFPRQQTNQVRYMIYWWDTGCNIVLTFLPSFKLILSPCRSHFDKCFFEYRMRPTDDKRAGHHPKWGSAWIAKGVRPWTDHWIATFNDRNVWCTQCMVFLWFKHVFFNFTYGQDKLLESKAVPRIPLDSKGMVWNSSSTSTVSIST